MSDEALLLGIDTSGAEGSLALARVDAEVHLLSQSLLTGRRYAAQLVPRLRAMIAESSRVLTELSAIVIVNGPGSFTGLRVGISATKALAEAASLPVISLSRLAVLCSLVGKDTVVVLDAGRGEYYVRLSSASGEPIESLESLPTLIEKAREVKLCICEPQLAGPLTDLHPVLVPPPTAFDAIRLAQPRWVKRSFDDVATLDANYVRRPYADHVSSGSVAKTAAP